MNQHEMSEIAEKTALKKGSQRLSNLLILSILGGVFIALGGLFSTLAITGSGSLPFGFAKIIMGVTFSLGLILVIIGGAELFTGSTLTSYALFGKKITLPSLIQNWAIVYFGNFIGSILIAISIFIAREYQINGGSFGTTIFSIANSKMHHSFIEAIILGILCNMLVCLAIWLTFGAKSLSDKILAIVFPVTAFVALGFEHSVANMYLVTEAIIIKNYDPSFVASKGIETASLTWSNFFMHNLLPVTIGNIIGGVIIWATIYRIYAIKK